MHSELSNNLLVYFQRLVLVLFDIVAQITNFNFVRLRVALIDDYKNYVYK